MTGPPHAFTSKRVASPPKPVERVLARAMAVQPAVSDQDAEGDYDESEVEDAEGELDEEPEAVAGDDESEPEAAVDEVEEGVSDEAVIGAASRKRRGARGTQRAQRVKHETTVESESDEDASDGGSASEAESAWKAEEEDESDIEDDRVELNRCLFCKETEDKDPGEVFEEMLTCASCTENG